MNEIKKIQVDDSEFECQGLLDFSSLVKLLYKLSKKQKSIENKIESINNRIGKKGNLVSNKVVIVKGESQTKDKDKEKEKEKEKDKDKDKEKKLFESNESDIKQKSSEEILEKPQQKQTQSRQQPELNQQSSTIKNIGSEIDGIEKEEKNEEDEKEDEEKDEYEKDEKDEMGIIETSRSSDMIMKLFKKVKDNEKKIYDLSKKTLEHQELNVKINENKSEIDQNGKKIYNANNSISEINKKLEDIDNVLENIKVKVQDFNIYDIFKSDGDGGNIDVAKALVMTLESKVFKKFELYDERFKKMDKDVFKMKDEFKNNMNLIEGAKMASQKITETLTVIKDNYSDEINQLKEKINNVTNDFSNLKTPQKKVGKSTPIESDKSLDKIKQFENYTELINSQLKKMQNDIEQNKKGVKSTNEDIEYLRRFFNELEKQLGKEIKEINIDDIRIKIQNLEEEMNRRKNKEEIIDIKKRLLIAEELIKEEEFKNETSQQSCDRIRGDISQITKKVEYLNQEYAKLALGKISSSGNNEQKDHPFDFTKFVEVSKFNDNKKEINNKFEKIRLAIENLGRNLENIVETLGHTPSDKDFEQFQGVIKNLIDEKNIIYYKKFADKIDVNKSIKYLETQIKNYIENNAKKLEGGDNWLLANKPIHNYQCASCEGIIRGELDKRSEYIPWNKYPSRDDKNYRMGHGFSRMLQLVNDDIMRSTNMNNDFSFNITSHNKDVNITEEDKKNNKRSMLTETNVENKDNVKLPKVKTKTTNMNATENNAVNNEKPTSNTLYEEYNTSTGPRPQILRIYRVNKNPNVSASMARNDNNFNEMQLTGFNGAGQHKNLSVDES